MNPILPQILSDIESGTLHLQMTTRGKHVSAVSINLSENRSWPGNTKGIKPGISSSFMILYYVGS